MRNTVAPVQSFGEFIKTKRLQLNLAQWEVGAMAGLSQGYVCKVENGEREPTLTVALKLCDALNLDINDFAKHYIHK
jgi:transcriptional regulator with XRE-family HTH domain